MGLRPRIYIASSYSQSGDKRSAAVRSFSAGRSVYESGGSPLMPLTSHYLMQEDHNDHRWWLARSHQEWVEEFDFPWVAAADAIYRLGGRSPGADAEVELATRLGIPVLLSLLDVQEFCAKWKPKEQHASSMERLWDKVKDINGGRKLPELEPLPYPAEEAAGSAEAERDARIMAAELGDYTDHQRSAEPLPSESQTAAEECTKCTGNCTAGGDIARRFAEIVEKPCHPKSGEFFEFLVDVAELHVKKGADYGTNSDVFANVRAAEEFGISPWVGVGIRIQDKLNRAKSMSLKGRLVNESLIDSLKDICAYAAICALLFKEEHAN